MKRLSISLAAALIPWLPWLLLLTACWGWRETWLAQHHAEQVAEIRWQEQEMRVMILSDAVHLLAPDKWRARDAIGSAMRAWNRTASRSDSARRAGP